MQSMSNRFLAILLSLLVNCTTVSADVPDFDHDARLAVANLTPVQGAKAVTIESISNKPVLVTFFASWCPPCLEEFSHLNKLAQKYQATDLRIVAINVYETWDDNDEARMQKFLETTQPAFAAVTGSEKIREMFGGIDRIPTVYGFDRLGNPGYRFIHKRGAQKTNATFDELDQAARKLLGLN